MKNHTIFSYFYSKPELPYRAVNLLYSFDLSVEGVFFYFHKIRRDDLVTAEEKKSWAEELLRQKADELGRLPKKDDFDEPTRSRIKAFLGPWPRALEAAGLKKAKEPPKKSKKKRKAASRSAQVPFSSDMKTDG